MLHSCFAARGSEVGHVFGGLKSAFRSLNSAEQPIFRSLFVSRCGSLPSRSRGSRSVHCQDRTLQPASSHCPPKKSPPLKLPDREDIGWSPPFRPIERSAGRQTNKILVVTTSTSKLHSKSPSSPRRSAKVLLRMTTSPCNFIWLF